MSDSLQPRGLQHARPLCPSLSLSLLKFMSTESMMLSNLLTLCCPFYFGLESFPASGFFPMSRLFASGSWSTGSEYIQTKCWKLFQKNPLSGKTCLLPSLQPLPTNWWLVNSSSSLAFFLNSRPTLPTPSIIATSNSTWPESSLLFPSLWAQTCRPRPTASHFRLHQQIAPHPVTKGHSHR